MAPAPWPARPSGRSPRASSRGTTRRARRSASCPGRPGRLPAPGRVGLLAWQRPSARRGYAAVEVLAPDGSPETAAANLFAALRRLDACGPRPDPRRAVRRDGPRPRDHGPPAPRRRARG